MMNSITRRGFLATTAAAIATASAGAATVPRNGASLRIGLLGPGRYGTTLLRAMDILGPRHNAKVVAVHRASLDVVKKQQLDGVIIATPDHLHAETSIAAMDAGLHVYCTSPMALSEQEAARVRDAAQASGVTFQVGGDIVLEPCLRAARSMVEMGAIGEVRWCSASANQDPLNGRSWPTNASFTNGPAARPLHDLWAACAFVTQVRTPKSVSSMGGTFDGDGELPDALHLSADFNHGVHFNLDCSPTAIPTTPTVIRGSEGSLIIQRESVSVMPEFLGAADTSEVWHPTDGITPSPLEEWLTFIRTGDPCTFDAELGNEASAGIARGMAAYRKQVAA